MPRALAQDARMLLLDEPTAHLDIAVQLEIMDLLLELLPGGLTLVAALHDLNLPAMYCRPLVLLERGRVAALGAPPRGAPLTMPPCWPRSRAPWDLNSARRRKGRAFSRRART